MAAGTATVPASWRRTAAAALRSVALASRFATKRIGVKRIGVKRIGVIGTRTTRHRSVLYLLRWLPTAGTAGPSSSVALVPETTSLATLRRMGVRKKMTRTPNGWVRVRVLGIRGRCSDARGAGHAGAEGAAAVRAAVVG
jgi:hypothetical protein